MSLKIKRTAIAACIISLLSSSVLFATETTAQTPVLLLKSKFDSAAISQTEMTQLVKQHFDINQYREVRTQVIYNQQHQVDHILVYLFSKKYHHFNTARMDVNAKLQVTSVQTNYRLTDDDHAQQPGIKASEAQCPDTSIQFIAFAADVYSGTSIKITKKVAKAAKNHSLSTASLWKKKATRENYLNYMTCPNLIGNFYDGYTDSYTSDQIATADGIITYKDLEEILNKKFRYKVTNIWVVDRGFNDPIKTTMLDVVQSQKYAAGVSDLLVGPSDDAAACSMMAAMDGQPMQAAFEACRLEHNTIEDQWGFDGKGSDIFGA